MKELARNKPVLCAGQYIEIQTSQPLTKVQARILANNRACYQQKS